MYFVQQTATQLWYAFLDGCSRVYAWLFTLLTRGTMNSMAASIIWVTGLWTTSTSLVELHVPGPTFLYAIALQSILTNGQGPLWHAAQRIGRRGALIIGIVCLLIDIGFNIGGLWIYLRHLGDTTMWAAISAATNNPNPPTMLTCFMVTAGVAVVVALGPEAMWDV